MTRRRTVLAAATAAAALAASRAAPAMTPSTPTPAAGDWESAPPESQGMHAAAVAETLQAGEGVPPLRALLAARNGVLVAERYYAGARADELQPVQSVTKSVCSMLVGIALRDGRIRSLDDTVAQLIPEAVAEVPGSPAAAVTLRQILSGRTGLGFHPMRFRELAGNRQLLRQVLAQPGEPVPPPGWSYNDAMVALLAPILARAHGGESLSTIAERQLFGPLGIASHRWQRDRDGEPLAPGGLSLRPRDLLKLAAVMNDGGRWRGTQVLPEAWVEDSLSSQGPATWGVRPVSDVGYGFLWFTGRMHGHRVAWGWGYGAQYALLVPELKLVVATAATAPPPLALVAQNDAVMALVARLVQAAAG
jgi:CubicO group peptidase (beta-lactamase class C family)